MEISLNGNCVIAASDLNNDILNNMLRQIKSKYINYIIPETVSDFSFQVITRIIKVDEKSYVNICERESNTGDVKIDFTAMVEVQIFQQDDIVKCNVIQVSENAVICRYRSIHNVTFIVITETAWNVNDVITLKVNVIKYNGDCPVVFCDEI